MIFKADTFAQFQANPLNNSVAKPSLGHLYLNHLSFRRKCRFPAKVKLESFDIVTHQNRRQILPIKRPPLRMDSIEIAKIESARFADIKILSQVIPSHERDHDACGRRQDLSIRLEQAPFGILDRWKDMFSQQFAGKEFVNKDVRLPREILFEFNRLRRFCQDRYLILIVIAFDDLSCSVSDQTDGLARKYLLCAELRSHHRQQA